jgi:hypothetical protein
MNAYSWKLGDQTRQKTTVPNAKICAGPMMQRKTQRIDSYAAILSKPCPGLDT